MTVVDGQYGPTFSEVRYLSNLSVSQIADGVIDQHLKEAFNETQSALKIDFVTSATTMTDITFNTKEVYHGLKGSSLFLSDFKDRVSGLYLPLLTISSVSYKVIDTGSWETQTEGQELDYTVDTQRNSIDFNFRLQPNGYKNLKFTGTGGQVASPLTSLPEKYKKVIALISAIKDVVYASGGKFDTVKSSSVGGITTSKGEYQANYTQQLKELKEQLERHLRAYGLRLERSSITLE